jgi:hypothetical protein
MIDEAFFAQVMGFLKAGYPGFNPPEETWRTSLAVYRQTLGHYPREIFARATAKAHTANPQWFPTVGQLREIFEAEHKGWLARQAHKNRPPVRGLLPERQALADDNPYEQLARRFEKGGGSQEEKARLLREVADGSLAK